MVWGVWNVVVYGPNIHLGKNCVIVGADGFRTTLTTVSYNGHQGSIKIGDNVLIMNGVRVSSASEIVIGDDCMLANFCYIMDADWHDIYDRTSSPGKTAPVILERGVWVGDSAIICKGVRIGENSIIGAGSVVRKDVPPNCVVIGNPARVVKKLDPARVVTMGKLYETENLKHKGK
ncbi:MAG: acyltransferase [Spirochaetes bacterium]|nr:acyltransferase [Spirochaetota bacterium]